MCHTPKCDGYRMEFGRIPQEQLSHVDFSLPADPQVNHSAFISGRGNAHFFIGCPTWGRKNWVGRLYPPKTKEKDYLSCYAQQFNSIEFNGFYYNLHSREQVTKWVSMVPDGFLFCPKFTQSITHLRRLKNVSAEVDAYLSVISEFGQHLGPILLMPNPQMGIKHRDTIITFLNELPDDLRVFLELRHPEWYAGNTYNMELLQLLSHRNVGTIITDAAGRRDCVHMHLSTPECFIRFVGNGLHPTDYTRIDNWVERINEWVKQGMERCYFFMHQHDELHSPELIKYFIRQLNDKCGTEIPLPVLYNDTTLF